MRKPETTFIASIHKLLPTSLHREKMNNPYSSGTPDVYYSGTRTDLWVEYKNLVKLPVRSTTVLADLSPLQVKWLRGRHTEGRNVYVIVGCPLGGVVLSNLEWEQPIPLSEFNKRTVTRQAIAEWLTLFTMEAPLGNPDTTAYAGRLRRSRKAA